MRCRGEKKSERDGGYYALLRRSLFGLTVPPDAGINWRDTAISGGLLVCLGWLKASAMGVFKLLQRARFFEFCPKALIFAQKWVAGCEKTPQLSLQTHKILVYLQ